MKHFQTVLLFAAMLVTFEIFAQTTANSNRWDLDKYVWSHGHADTKQGKPMLDYPAIDKWPVVSGEGFAASRDARYFAYVVINLNDNRQLDSIIVKSMEGSWKQVITGKVKPGFFSGDGKQYVYSDNGGLTFMLTGSQERKFIKDVGSFLVPANGRNEWLAMQLKDKEKTVVLQNLLNGSQRKITGVASYSFDKTNQWLICQLTDGRLLLQELGTGKDITYNGVESFLENEGGVFLLSCHTSEGKQVLKYVKLNDPAEKTLWESANNNERVGSIVVNKTCSKIAFLVTAKNVASQQGEHSDRIAVWYWKMNESKAASVYSSPATRDNTVFSISNIGSFLGDDRYLVCSSQGKPEKKAAPLAGAVQLDVWSYKDKVLQSVQALAKEQATEETALYDLELKKIVRLENGRQKFEQIVLSGCALLGNKGSDGKGDRFWEDGYEDDSTWVLSIATGSKQLLRTNKGGGSRDFSPDGQYMVFFDAVKGCNYISYQFSTGKKINISSAVSLWQLGYTKFNERTSQKPRFGSGVLLWLDNRRFLVRDDYDIWELDVTGEHSAINVTNGFGRAHSIELDLLTNNRNNTRENSYRSGDTLILSAFNTKTKYRGFYRKVLGQKGDPQLLSMSPYYLPNLNTGSLDFPKRIADHQWILMRENATSAPNFFLTNDFKTFTALTDQQPQAKNSWFTSELHQFKQMDGTMSQGVLYKPENFDPSKKYPVIVSFYGDLSDRMYRYPSGGYYIQDPSIFANPSWMVSHGYLVFIPDIYFTEGKWGPSTVNTIDGAARYLRTLGYVDGNHLGAAGHSNSGRFGYYLLTHTTLFQAISVGAGTTDIISNGLSLKKQKQSQLEWAEHGSYGTGLGNLWTNKSRWLDHTSILSADKVSSPVLMFHNRNDGSGAFDPGQAVEMFIALRRLGKPAWWMQYDKGTHQVYGNDARDFTIRYTQFFDHYLKGAPAPTWMTKGIDFKDKGVVTGYNLDPSGSCKKDCKICKRWNEQYSATSGNKLSKNGSEKSKSGNKATEKTK